MYHIDESERRPSRNLLLHKVMMCTLEVFLYKYNNLLPTGSEERGVLGVGSIPVAILPSCQDIKNDCIIIA